MLEREIETYLRNEVGRIGGTAYKFVSPGNDGVPDRLVCLPGEIVAFVELKAPGKKPTPLQERQIERLDMLGFTTFVLDSKAGVDQFIRAAETLMREKGRRV